MGGVFFDALFNLNKFIGFEQRDPFAERQRRNDPFETDWDRWVGQQLLAKGFNLYLIPANLFAMSWPVSRETGRHPIFCFEFNTLAVYINPTNALFPRRLL